MAFVDTNILLRWLLGDHKELSPKAEEIINTAKPGSLIITDIVVAEIVYVLRSTGRDRAQIAEALLLIGRTKALKYENNDLVMGIVEIMSQVSLDFADYYLLTRASRENTELATFDNKVLKLARLRK